jgi:hypothetical protein
VRIELDGVAELRNRASEAEFVTWAESLAFHVGRALRATDLLAAESESRFCVLLPETDSVGAAVLKRRMRAAVERSEPWRALEASERRAAARRRHLPSDHAARALWSALEARVDEDRRSLVRSLELEAMPFRGLVDALLAEGIGGRPETGEQMPLPDRGGGAAPRARPPVRRARAGWRRSSRRFERAARLPPAPIVLVANARAPVSACRHLISPFGRAQSPFLIYFGEGAPHARERQPRTAG